MTTAEAVNGILLITLGISFNRTAPQRDSLHAKVCYTIVTSVASGTEFFTYDIATDEVHNFEEQSADVRRESVLD